MEPTINSQLQLAHEFVHHTGRNVFLSGKAGTGKTTFLHRLKESTDKRMVVVAPTGVAAINAGGVTIHSFFQLSFGPQIPEEARLRVDSRGMIMPADASGIKKFSREKIRLIRSLDLVVIDEISMVRADILDAIDEVLRRFRHSSQPFGGVQMLLIGDLFQLSPVVKDDEWEILRPYYQSVYFFNSKAYQRASFVPIELMHIYRQQDKAFIELLNAVRNNQANDQILSELNKRYRPDFRPTDEEGYITLTTHNAVANEINYKKLESINAKSVIYKAVIEQEFPEYAYPGEAELKIKVGAQVMFIKNDLEAERRFFNGKIGKVIAVSEEIVVVKCPGDLDEINVLPMTWRNIRYSVNEETKDVLEDVIGTFTQLPLKLAWAITIHKSQGLTFDKAIIDAQSAFAYGQVYVALSRCRNLEGLVLRTRIAPHCIITDETISRYTQDSLQQAPDHLVLMDARRSFQLELLNELFDFYEIRRRYDALLRAMEAREAGLNPESILTMRSIITPMQSELLVVSERFKNEIVRIATPDFLPVDNVHLADRTKKACVYFVEKVKTVLGDALMNFAFETDNKEVKKIVGEQLEGLQKAVYVKLKSLESCVNGFEVLHYLKARAHAELDFRVSPRQHSSGKKVGTTSSKHPLLYKELTAWRDNKATENNVDGSRIVRLKSLVEISNLLPSNIRELEIINGIGKKKIKEYGKELVELVNAYCEKFEIERIQDSIPEPVIKEKSPLPDSKKRSLDLFVTGMSIAEIAEQRGFAISTIEAHLAYYVGEGILEVSSFVSQEKLERISSYFLDKENSDSLAIAKSFFGDDVSYSELRFTLNHLRFLHRE